MLEKAEFERHEGRERGMAKHGPLAFFWPVSKWGPVRPSVISDVA